MATNGVRKAIAAKGGAKALADALRLSKQAVSKWRRVPAARVLQVERVTGIAREDLRPDLYRRKP